MIHDINNLSERKNSNTLNHDNKNLHIDKLFINMIHDINNLSERKNSNTLNYDNKNLHIDIRNFRIMTIKFMNQ